MSITNKFIQTVKDTIIEHNMFKYNDTVVIGVSGGADSIMLLHCLNSLKKDFNLKLIVAHVNHKIRKGSAERDAEFVRSFCKELGLPFYLNEVDIPNMAKELNLSDEEGNFLLVQYSDLYKNITKETQYAVNVMHMKVRVKKK